MRGSRKIFGGWGVWGCGCIHVCNFVWRGEGRGSEVFSGNFTIGFNEFEFAGGGGGPDPL